MENEKEKKTEEKPEEKSIPKLVELVDRLEKANAETKELQAKNEELHARKLLGSESEAGTQPEPVKVESPQEYAEKALRGELNE